MNHWQSVEHIQSLWSGYGSIARCIDPNDAKATVVVKHIKYPDRVNHPRGWSGSLSHQRKVSSYQVEIEWYRRWAQYCDEHCRIPRCLDIDDSKPDEFSIVLEDLDAAGFDKRLSRVKWDHMQSCLKWLAHFHATFMQQDPQGLWPIGTYWHLDTRPDELMVLDDIALKQAAKAIDQQLNQSAFLTFVHGDAKLANFCFSAKGNAVAAVDFQYVGGGCGMKDVAYFIGSCLDEADCEQREEQVLETYFSYLKHALMQVNKTVDFGKLEADWRPLYRVAWADFHRFLKGWSPGHWKINSYSERVVREVIASL